MVLIHICHNNLTYHCFIIIYNISLFWEQLFYYKDLQKKIYILGVIKSQIFKKCGISNYFRKKNIPIMMTATNWISKIMTQRWTEIPKLVVKENWWFLLEVSTSYQINNTQLLLISCVECEKQTFSKPLMTVNED